VELSAGTGVFQQVRITAPPAVAVQQFLALGATSPGFAVVQTGPNSLVIRRRFLPLWALIVAIVGFFVIFVFSLLFLLVRQEEALAITVVPDGSGARVDVQGFTSADMTGRITAIVSSLGGQMLVGGAPTWSPAGATMSPPGWHPDPADRTKLRYWDGNAWTHHVTDAAAPAPADEPPQA
jgi:hypothetical protein